MTIHAAANNFKMVEVPTNYRDRPEGSESKLNTVSDGIKVLKTIFTLFKEYKPGFFFNLWAFILLVISMIFCVPVFIEYFNTGFVPRFPTLIFGLILLVISILLWITGIILQVIVKKQRQLYELYLNSLESRNHD